MREVTVWGADGCMNCDKMVRALQGAGIPHTLKHVDGLIHVEPEVRREVMATVSLGGGALPVVQVGDWYMSEAEAYKALDAGELA